MLAALGLLGCGAQDVLTAPAQRSRVAAETVDPADATDALFMGAGPLIPRDGNSACPLTRVWTGFPRSTTVRVRASSQVPPNAQAALRAAVDQVAGATGGAVRAIFELVDGDLLPGPNEVTVTVRGRPRDEGCASDRGCVQQMFRAPGVLLSSRVVEPPDQPVAEYVRHAIGRGILGMCQIDARLIGGAGNSVMGAGSGARPGDGAASLTALDLAATQAVYTSALGPGATRKDFLDAGLVHVQAGERRRAAAAR
jgi:hypothetical protein